MSIPCSEAKYDTNGMWYVSLNQIEARHTHEEFVRFQRWCDKHTLTKGTCELKVYLYDYENWLRFFNKKVRGYR